MAPSVERASSTGVERAEKLYERVVVEYGDDGPRAQAMLIYGQESDPTSPEYTQQMERSDVTYSEMFKKVKRELAKQKGIIL